MKDFKIQFLDHVAIRVEDMDRSAQWYEEVLGLRKYQLEEWGRAPIFMLSGKTGVALFPANLEAQEYNRKLKGIGIDHFAFNVSKKDFVRARQKYDQLGLEYDFQDHVYFHSIYTQDPDGHVVELTTIVVDEEIFYQ